MQEEHRKAIQSNFVSLVEQTDLDLMVSALYEKGVFSERMIEPYKDTNKEVRFRKRQLYLDVTRRGPEAFGHLLDALSEAGYWDLVKDLDPNSSLHVRHPRNPMPSTSKNSNENSFVSLSTEKRKSKIGGDASKNSASALPAVAAAPAGQDMPDPSKIPQFHVVKSSKFFEDNGGVIKLYRARGRSRGVLVVFSYIEFPNNMEPYRYGVNVDCNNLKYLFDELGFKVISYPNLTRNETLDTLKFLKEVTSDAECLFIVVSSHGYELTGSSDNDVRCSDGRLVRISEIIEHFNNKNFPALRGIPKLFIFQMCRGSNDDYLTRLQRRGAARAHAVADGTAVGGGAPRHAPPLEPEPEPDRVRYRIYSDILIAHSTLPGSVAYRDHMEGSWYIQALCEVFAAHAHDCHVEELFILVDKQLDKRFHIQTSSVDSWGFNKRLYLHPGLYEDADGNTVAKS